MDFSRLDRIAMFAMTALLLAAPCAHAATACAGGTKLLGHYGMLVAGTSLDSGYGRYMTGSLYFNGNCRLSASNVNGGINKQLSNSAAVGQYSLNADSSYTIQLNLTGQTSPQIYIVGVGAVQPVVVGLETDGSAVATITLTPQNSIGAYNLASLANIYRVSCTGNGGSFSDLNIMSFDGQGNLTGTDVYNNEGDQGVAPITGTYKVYSDGTFAATLTNNFQGYSLTGVLQSGLSSIAYTYAISGTGGVVACTGVD